MTEHLPGDFQLARMGGAGGKIARILQGLNGDGFHDFEHARLYVGNGYFIEGMPGGAAYAQHLPLEWDGVIWSSGIIRLTPGEREAIVAAAIGYGPHDGKPGVGYSWLDYLSLAAQRLNIWIPGLKAYIKSTNHMICSQLVARCYFDGGHPLFDYWSGDVTPGDLYHLIRDD